MANDTPFHKLPTDKVCVVYVEPAQGIRDVERRILERHGEEGFIVARGPMPSPSHYFLDAVSLVAVKRDAAIRGIFPRDVRITVPVDHIKLLRAHTVTGEELL